MRSPSWSHSGEPGTISMATKKREWTETSEASQEEEEEEGEGEKTEGEEGGAREGEGLCHPQAKRLAQGTPPTGHLRWV